MVNGWSRFKPGVSQHTLLLMSACLWTAIGLMLLVKGGYRLSQLPQYHPLLLFAPFVAGSLKSYFVLDRVARRTIQRILQFKDGTCLGAVYSVKTWIVVLFMIAMGVILRNSSLPGNILCFVYFTVGWALLMSSRLAWRAWLIRH
ncbi:MAG: hypothetical protein ACN4GW_13725 [Desulforhopalus sp.]